MAGLIFTLFLVSAVFTTLNGASTLLINNNNNNNNNNDKDNDNDNKYKTGNCVCTENHDPVCGHDGMTYSNECFAECENQLVECKGECPCQKVSLWNIQMEFYKFESEILVFWRLGSLGWGHNLHLILRGFNVTNSDRISSYIFFGKSNDLTTNLQHLRLEFCDILSIQVNI